MFKKLRNRIVGISMLSTTIVLVVAFSVIYSTVAANTKNRPMPKPQFNASVIFEDNERSSFSEEMGLRIKEDREEGLRVLLVSLIVSGISIEVLVFLFSLYLANQSIKPVKETYNAQKQFIANASHEIKTPLAVIQANLEAADIKDNEWVNNAMQKAEELADLNNQLLALARVDANANKSKKSEIDLSKSIDNLVKPLKPQMDKKGIECTIEKISTRKVTLDSAAFKQVLNILLDNAIKYCDKKISITVDSHEVRIKNDGTTIAPEKLTHLFERFYQVDKTKSGVGLGLAIASEVANKNGWKLSAESDKKSTSFILKF